MTNSKPKIWTARNILIEKWIRYPNGMYQKKLLDSKFISKQDYDKEIENWNIHYNNQQKIIDELKTEKEQLKKVFKDFLIEFLKPCETLQQLNRNKVKAQNLLKELRL